MEGYADFPAFRARLYSPLRLQEAMDIITAAPRAKDLHGHGFVFNICRYGNRSTDVNLLRHALRLECPALTTCGGCDYSPLHWATDNPDMIRILLDYGVPVDLVCGMMMITPLASSLSKGDWPSARMLIDAGADLAKAIPSDMPPKKRIVEHLKLFVATREKTRMGCIAVLGLLRANAATLGRNNGKDILRMIARCLWATRGIKLKE